MARVILCVVLHLATVLAVVVFVTQHNVSAYEDESLKQQLNDYGNENSEGLPGGKEEKMSDRSFETAPEQLTDENKNSQMDSELLNGHEGETKPDEQTPFDKISKDETNREQNDQLVGHLKKLGEQALSILGGVEDIDYVPNGRDFYTHFLRKQKPLVMRGAASDWSAVKHWANETYMREKYGHVIFDVEFTKHYERIHPIKKTMNLSEYLNIYKTKQVYLDCPFPHSDLTADIMVPYCLQCDEVMSTIASIHLLYSSGNTSSSLHQDGYQNLLTLISGTKEVLIVSSDSAEHLYANNYTTVPGLSPVNPESVDLKTYPNVSKVTFHKVRNACNSWDGEIVVLAKCLCPIEFQEFC